MNEEVVGALRCSICGSFMSGLETPDRHAWCPVCMAYVEAK